MWLSASNGFIRCQSRLQRTVSPKSKREPWNRVQHALILFEFQLIYFSEHEVLIFQIYHHGLAFASMSLHQKCALSLANNGATKGQKVSFDCDKKPAFVSMTVWLWARAQHIVFVRAMYQCVSTGHFNTPTYLFEDLTNLDNTSTTLHTDSIRGVHARFGTIV